MSQLVAINIDAIDFMVRKMKQLSKTAPDPFMQNMLANQPSYSAELYEAVRCYW